MGSWRDCGGIGGWEVSNLLSSPASGEQLIGEIWWFKDQRFQFIEFPSEWGVDTEAIREAAEIGFPIY